MIDRRSAVATLAAAFLGAALACVSPGRAAPESPGRATPELTLLAHAPANPEAHPPLIVLLHGAGADERDMIGLWRQLPPQFVVVSPRGPFAEAGGGYRWYRKATRERDIAVSREIIDLIVESAVERFHADPARVVLGGFSQGAVMTYETVLREPGRYRGGAVLSGSILSSEVVALSSRPPKSYPTLFVGHGTADPRIPFSAALAAEATLGRLGVPIAFHAYSGMGHEVRDDEVADVSSWLSALSKSDP